jgi:hypothetical protein
MNWNTELIDKLTSLISNGVSLKSIVREISIDSILNDFDAPLSFPFYLPNKTSSEIDVNYRSANINFKYTDDEISNYYKFKEDPVSLLKFIYNNDTFKYQEDIINTFNSKKLLVIESLRGFGGNEILSFCILHYIMFNTDKSIVIFDHESSRRVFKQYELLPFYLKPGIEKRTISDKVYQVEFDNGNRITIRKYDENFKYYSNHDLIFVNKVPFDKDMMIVIITAMSRQAKVVFSVLSSSDNYDKSIFENFSKIDIAEYLK